MHCKREILCKLGTFRGLQTSSKQNVDLGKSLACSLLRASFTSSKPGEGIPRTEKHCGCIQGFYGRCPFGSRHSRSRTRSHSRHTATSAAAAAHAIAGAIEGSDAATSGKHSDAAVEAKARTVSSMLEGTLPAEVYRDRHPTDITVYQPRKVKKGV
jgi:hypothetical protein